MAPADSSSRTELSRLRLSAAEKSTGGARLRLVLAFVGLGVFAAVLVGLAVAVSGDGGGEVPARAAAAEGSTEPGSSSPASDPLETSEGVLAGGYVEARRTAQLMPGRDGVVARVMVSLGQEVRRGEVLLELDTAPYLAEREMAAAELELARARLRGVRAGSRSEEVLAASAEADAAEADWREAREQLERYETLAPSGAVTAAEVERARHRARAAEARFEALQARARLLRRGSRQTEIEAARATEERAAAALRRAEAMLELCRLRAPFDGVVVAIDVEPGEAVSLQSGRPVLALADLSEIWVRVDVPEARISAVRLGAAAEVVVDALGQDRLGAEVVEISPVADRQSNTVSVAVRVSDPPPLLRPNMSARVSIGARGSS